MQIQLTQGQVTTVDPKEYARLSQFKWHAWWNVNGKCFYAVRTLELDGKKTTSYMHREIMRAPKGVQVDHEDHDTLNNQRYNLRCASCSENGCNRGKQINNKSGFKGVRWHTRDKCWMAAIKIHQKYKHLGTFASAEDAFEAYKQAARTLHGEFACW